MSQGDLSGLVDAVGTDAVLGVGVLVAGGGLGAGLVGGCGGGPVRQRPVWSVVVVLADEGLDEALELGDGGWLLGLGREPLLHRLLEPFDLAAGGR